MSQAGYTPIQLYFSTTAAAVPVNTNLANGELAINIQDEKLYFKNAAGTVKLLASNATSAPVLSFSAGTTGFTPSTATTGAITLAGTLATTNGGTGLTAFTANQVFYASSTSAFAQSANLTFNGTTLTANTIGAFTLGGTIAGGGNQINNVIIGTTTPLAGAFTTLSATGVATFSAGTVSLPAITTSGDTNTGIFFPAADTIAFTEGGVESMRIDASGNLGLGVTPSAWYTGGKALQILNGSGGSLNAYSGEFFITQNAYLNSDASNWIRSDAGFVSQYHQVNGQHIWKNAVSSTAGSVVSFVEGMRLTSTGLGIGTSSPSARLQIDGTTDATQRIIVGGTGNVSSYKLNYNGSEVGFIQNYQNTEMSIGTTVAASLGFNTNNTQRFIITSAGALGIGATPSYGTSGQVLTSGGSSAAPTWTTVSGGGSQWTTSGSNIYYNTGSVFIGATSATGGSNFQVSAGSGASSTPAVGIYNTASSPTSSASTNLTLGFGNGNSDYIATNTIIGTMNFIGQANDATYVGAFMRALCTSGGNVGRASGHSVDLLWGAKPTDTTGNSEMMRLDGAGRLGINTTTQSTNLARLQVTHSASSDRYGIYVPGGVYTGSGPSGTQYGGYFSNHTSNQASSVVGVAGVISNTGSASTIYGGYFDGNGTASFTAVGVYGLAKQSDNGGPGTAMGGHFVVTTPNPSAGGSGNMYAVRAENQANKGSTAYGVYSTTLPGANNILGYTYEHNGSLMFRVKANGGIDNFSANNSNLSDRREKKDFAPAKSYLETICAIPVQTFKYINQTDDLPNLGIVAQDVQAVAPEFVAESNWARHDEEPKMRLSVYETDLVYALMKSIQELNAKFEEYKASHP